MKAQTLTWNRTYTGVGDNKGSGIEKTFDGNFIVSGITTNAANVSVALLMKIDGAGDTLWTKTYDNIYNSGGLCVKQCNDSGFVIAGYKSNASGSLDFYIIKTLSNGTVDWTRTYGGVLNEGSYSIIQTYDSGFAVCGYTASEGAGGKDMLLVKYNKNGVIQWHRTYGGTNDELAYALCQTPDSGYAIAGSTKSYSDNSLEDIYVIGTQPNGDSLWTQTYKHAGTDIALDIIRCKDDGYAICGKSNSTEDNLYDMFILRIRDNGHQMFFKTYGTIANEAANAVREADNSAFLLGGYTCTDNGTKTAAALWISDYGDSLSWQVNEETQSNQITSFCFADDETIMAIGSLNSEDNTTINNGGNNTNLFTGLAIGPIQYLCFYPRSIWIQDCFQQQYIDNKDGVTPQNPWHPELNILNDNFTYDCSNAKWDTVAGASWTFKEAALIAYINNGRFHTITLGHLEDILREDNPLCSAYFPSLCSEYNKGFVINANCTTSTAYDFANSGELKSRLAKLIDDLYNQTAVTSILAQWREFDGYPKNQYIYGGVVGSPCYGNTHNTHANNYESDEDYSGGTTVRSFQLFDYFKTFNYNLWIDNINHSCFKGIVIDYEYWHPTYGKPNATTNNFEFFKNGFLNFLTLVDQYTNMYNKRAGCYTIVHGYLERVVIDATPTTSVATHNYFDIDGSGTTNSDDIKQEIEIITTLNLDAYELAWFYRDNPLSNTPFNDDNFKPSNFLLPLFNSAANATTITASKDRAVNLLRLFYLGHNAYYKQIHIIPVFDAFDDLTASSSGTGGFLGNWLYGEFPWNNPFTPHYFIDAENDFLYQSTLSQVTTSDFQGTYSGTPPSNGVITTRSTDHWTDFGTIDFKSGFSYFKYFMSHNTSRIGDAYQPTFSCIGPLPQRLIAQEIPTTNSIQNVDAKSVVMVSPNPFSSKTTLKIVGSRNTFTAAAIKIYNVSGIDVTGQFSLAIIADNEMELNSLYAEPGIYYLKSDALQTNKLTLIPR